jgi:2-C-methyl-D-erythritol 4-phosphate cytidylyltransferase
VVVPRGWEGVVREQLEAISSSGLIVTTGGVCRQDSTYEGLHKLSSKVKIVLIHDAARPFVSSRLIRRVVDGAHRFGACVPALPIIETVKEVKGNRVVRTLDRDRLRLIQTPQGFEVGLLKRALARSLANGFHGTDEAVMVERLGTAVFVVEGEMGNVKVTWPRDLVYCHE